LVLEVINRYELTYLNTAKDALELIKAVDSPNLKLHLDTFHMNIEEPNMIESILKAKDYIAHVHFADSNRWAPGCGHINFPEIIKTLQQINYGGAISAEILPEPSPEESVRLTIEYYKKLGL
jgi:sugar phosphate isomerase/epimerase